MSYHLQGVQESGELVESLSAVVRHSVVNDTVKFVDVGQTQFVKVFLTLQTLDWNC